MTENDSAPDADLQEQWHPVDRDVDDGDDDTVDVLLPLEADPADAADQAAAVPLDDEDEQPPGT